MASEKPMTDSDDHSTIMPMDGMVVRRADTKIFITQAPVPCIVALIMQKGESTDMDMLLLTEKYRTQGIHVLVMDISEDCLDAGEERDRNKVRDLLSMLKEYEVSRKEGTNVPHMLSKEENGGVES